MHWGTECPNLSRFLLEVLAEPHDPKGAADDILIDQEHEGSRQHCLQ